MVMLVPAVVWWLTAAADPVVKRTLESAVRILATRTVMVKRRLEARFLPASTSGAGVDEGVNPVIESAT
jgi:hypothetical protein